VKNHGQVMIFRFQAEHSVPCSTLKFGKMDRRFTENKGKGGFLPNKKNLYRIWVCFTDSENGLPNLTNDYQIGRFFTESGIYRIGTEKNARFGKKRAIR
jgi:hypothetical protein